MKPLNIAKLLSFLLLSFALSAELWAQNAASVSERASGALAVESGETQKVSDIRGTDGKSSDEDPDSLEAKKRAVELHKARVEKEMAELKIAEQALPQSESSAKIDEISVARFQHLRDIRIFVVKYLRSNGYDMLADFMVAKFLGIRVVAICFALFVLLFTWIFQGLIVNLIFKLFRAIFERVRFSHINKVLDKIRRPMRFLVILTGLRFALFTLVNDSTTLLVAGRIFAAIGLALIFWMLLTVVDFSFQALAKRMETRNSSAKHLVFLLGRIFEYSLVFIAILLVLDHMGVKISALVASLGIGGAALAFASKDTIANLFGSISIVADRPFVLGDWVKVGDVEGIVDNVGVRSTRIRTFQKTLVTIPNSVLANESVDNYSKMPTRKAVMSVGLTYSTSAAQIEQIVADFKEILNKNPGVENGSELVNFINFGASSLDIQLIYYTYNTDLAGYLQTMQSVNLSIMRAVEARGLSFAFPSTSLYIEKK